MAFRVLFALCLAVSLSVATARPPSDWLVAPGPPKDKHGSPVDAILRSDIDLEDPLFTQQFTAAVQRGGNCSAHCNGDRLSLTSGEGDNRAPLACLGTFRAFCRGRDAERDVRGGFALKCEGQFTAKMDNDTGLGFAVCEGLFRHLVRIYPPSECPVRVVTKAAGCLGTASAVKSGNRSSSDALAWTGSPNADLQDASAAVAAVAADRNRSSVMEGRCEGLGGKVTVLQGRDCGGGACMLGFARDRLLVADVADGFELLEGEINDTLAEAGVGLDAEPGLALGTDVAGLLAGAGRRGGPDCRITCNGRPAFLRGAFPCWGKLAVDCVAGGDDDHDDDDDDDDDRCSVGLSERELAERGCATFTASCQGFWSGALGARCSGFSSERGEWAAHGHGGARYDFCSGRRTMRVKKGRGRLVMAQFCKGKELAAAVRRTGDDDDDDDK